MPNSLKPNAIWSPAKTVAWFGAIFAVDFLVQSSIVVLATVFAVAHSGGKSDVGLLVNSMIHDGQVFISAALASAVLVITSITVLTHRKSGSVFRYLAIRPISFISGISWLLVGLLFSVVQIAIFTLCGLPSSDFWHGIYLSAWLKPFLFVVMVIAAPAAEEVMYRGFLFRGLLATRLGAPGAVVITSLAWATAHMQYNLWERGAIFTLGLLLGTLRQNRHSLTIPFLIHAGVNATGFFLIMSGF